MTHFSLWPILILSSNLHMQFPSGLFWFMLSYKTLYASLLCMSHTCTYKKHENIPKLYEIHVHSSFKHTVWKGALLSASQVLSVIQSGWALILERDSKHGFSTRLVKYTIKKNFKQQPSGRYFDFMWLFLYNRFWKIWHVCC